MVDQCLFPSVVDPLSDYVQLRLSSSNDIYRISGVGPAKVKVMRSIRDNDSSDILLRNTLQYAATVPRVEEAVTTNRSNM